VSEQGYTVPTPIQAQAIPVVLAGKDLLAAAQTGTGKTAGFTLPLLQLLNSRVNAKKAIRCLILVPTRELAAQVQESVRVYGKYKPLRSITIFGGVNINPQIQDLRRGVDIVVATPGRLLDHVQQKTIDLRHVEILVLDEADRMLDMGFIHDIRRIIGLLPKQRQNLMFSATFPEEIRKLAGTFMQHPQLVEVARRNTPAELVAQVQHPVDQSRKKDLLAHLVKENNWQQVLVFTKTKRGANRLAEALDKSGIEADAIHGNKSQPQRTRVLKRFKDNELQVLVATDIAARGIDIDELPHVVNFDLPHVPEDYVHRIGRTGRAGSSGEAVSLVAFDDRPLMRDIEKLMNRQVEVRVIPGFEPGNPLHQQPREPQQNRGGRPQQRQHQRPQQQNHRRGGTGSGRPGGGKPGNRNSNSRPHHAAPKQQQQQPQVQPEAPRQGPVQYPRTISRG
jgi:ATP-dependent RNA helicase RhlE